MAVNRQTLYLMRRLRTHVGAEADATTTALTAAWVRAWDELSILYTAALADITAEAVRLGHWPQPWELARIPRLQAALVATEGALAALGRRAGVTVTDAAGNIVRATGDAEPRIIASQLPAADQVAGVTRFAAKVLPSAFDIIIARTQALIVGQTRALSGPAMEAMRRALIAGVATGAHPTVVAADMLARVEGEFNGGLYRALTISRTELLDAYRVASQYTHTANTEVLDGWRWLASLDRRTCPACWAKNGTLYPASTPGPWGHPNCRCARVPVVKSWTALGLHGQAEPRDTFPDAKARFDALPRADQLAIMGPGRLAALDSGQAAWSDLATRRDTPTWRPSYVATPVRDLVSTG